jgi:hypothetical protein
MPVYFFVFSAVLSLLSWFPLLFLSSEYSLSYLGMITQAYNPSYLGSRDWEDCHTRLAQAKNSGNPQLNQ